MIKYSVGVGGASLPTSLKHNEIRPVFKSVFPAIIISSLCLPAEKSICNFQAFYMVINTRCFYKKIYTHTIFFHPHLDAALFSLALSFYSIHLKCESISFIQIKIRVTHNIFPSMHFNNGIKHGFFRFFSNPMPFIKSI